MVLLPLPMSDRAKHSVENVIQVFADIFRSRLPPELTKHLDYGGQVGKLSVVEITQCAENQ